jgi:VanZ family protein
MLRLLTFGTLGCYWTAIFIGTHVPPSFAKIPKFSDKLLHLGAYAGLAFFLAAALTACRLKRGTLLITVAVAAAYGCVDELTQLLVAGRHADVGDWAADVFGASVGAVAFAVGLLLITGRFPNAVNSDKASTNHESPS